MTSNATLRIFVLISIGSAVSALLIFFVLFPWAESQPDPDAIQAPAWFVMLLFVAVAIISGAVSVVLRTRRPA